MNEIEKTATVNDYLENRVNLLNKVQDNLLWSECGTVTLAFLLTGIFAQVFATVSVLMMVALAVTYVQFKVAEGRKSCVDAYMNQLAAEETVKGTVFIPALQTVGMNLEFVNEERKPVEFQREATNNTCQVITYRDGVQAWQRIAFDDIKESPVQKRVSVL